MATWTSEELKKVGNAEELQISSLRENGTLRKPVTIWVVRIGDDLYVRSVNGITSGWFRGTRAKHEGHIQAGGVDKDVTFVDVTDPALIEQVDEAYRTKYRQYITNYVPPMLTPGARAATIKLIPS